MRADQAASVERAGKGITMMSSPSTAASLAAAGLALVVAGGAWWSTSATERQIEARSQAALTASGIEGVQVRADGRDIVVSGDQAAGEQARSALAEIPGAREVRLTAASDDDSAAQAPASTGAAQTPAPGASPTSSADHAPSGRAPATQAGAVRFAKGSAQLDAAAERSVAEIASHLERYERLSVVLIGRTSDEGSTDASLALSWQRAQRVGDAIVAAGIAPSRVSTAGTGEMVVDSPSMANLLRRVDVVYEER